MNKGSEHEKNNSTTKVWKHFAVKLAESYINIRIVTHLWLAELYTVYYDYKNWLLNQIYTWSTKPDLPPAILWNQPIADYTALCQPIRISVSVSRTFFLICNTTSCGTRVWS